MQPVRAIVPEILAPAGSPQALIAAVQNGADAVYLGLQTMNARRGAENFTFDDLLRATTYSHLRGVQIYLTANIVTLPEEIHDALLLVDEAWASGVDAVIVQDLGLLRSIRRELPDVRVHASTQIGAHNSATVEALEQLGVSRVTLARETPLEGVERIVATSRAEIETFVHGALCYSYSGQCLMSSMIGRRSANRGLCAQPCRLPYALIGEDGIRAETPGRYLLSPRDLAAIEILPALVRAGVRALKIEGRMKSPEYVALVVRVYREALERAVADPEGYQVTRAEGDILEEAFNRGFTQGHLAGARGEKLMSYGRPNNRGVPIGRVEAFSDGRAVLALDRALDAEDTVEFWTGDGRFAQRAGEMLSGGATVREAPAGSKVRLATDKRVSAGDRVFRVANAALLAAARRSFASKAERRQVPVDATATVRVGDRLEVTLRAGAVEGRGTGPESEAARTKAVTAGEVMEHVGRLGGTPYRVASWDLAVDGLAGIGFSALHAARRQAVQALDTARLAPWEGRPRRHPRVREARRARKRPSGVSLDAVVGSAEAAAACLAAGADRALVTVGPGDDQVVLPPGAVALLPRIAPDDEVEHLLEWCPASSTVVAGNLGVLSAAARGGARVEADWGLNALNGQTAEVLAELGAAFVWASPELSSRQVASLVDASPLPVGAVAYGYLELMVAEQCVLQAVGACGRRCVKCARRDEGWVLRDQKGYEFPVRTDAQGRSHVYNAVPLELSRALPELLSTGVTRLRMELRLDGPASAAEQVSAFRLRLEEALAGRAVPDEPLLAPATSGHFFRGVR